MSSFAFFFPFLVTNVYKLLRILRFVLFILKAPAGGVASATSGMGNLNIGGGFMGDIPRPTIRPANPFNCEQDTQTLRTAMKGIGIVFDFVKANCHIFSSEKLSYENHHHSLVKKLIH